MKPKLFFVWKTKAEAHKNIYHISDNKKQDDRWVIQEEFEVIEKKAYDKALKEVEQFTVEYESLQYKYTKVIATLVSLSTGSYESTYAKHLSVKILEELGEIPIQLRERPLL